MRSRSRLEKRENENAIVQKTLFLLAKEKL